MQQFHGQNADMRTMLGGLRFLVLVQTHWPNVPRFQVKPHNYNKILSHDKVQLGVESEFVVFQKVRNPGGGFLAVVQSITSSTATT